MPGVADRLPSGICETAAGEDDLLVADREIDPGREIGMVRMGDPPGECIELVYADCPIPELVCDNFP